MPNQPIHTDTRVAAFLLSVLVTAAGPVNTQLPKEAYRINPTKDPQAPFQVYVPEDLEDAFVELEKMLRPELIADIKSRPEKDMIEHHFGLGIWMRNNWALWKGSRLSEYFNKLGIDHPDDMAGIILDSFWRHLNNRPIDLDSQIARYKAYWENARKDQAKGKK